MAVEDDSLEGSYSLFRKKIKSDVDLEDSFGALSYGDLKSFVEALPKTTTPWSASILSLTEVRLRIRS